MLPIIGLDLDGVIIDNSQIKLAIAKKLGFVLTIKDTPSEIIKTIIPEEKLRQLQRLIYDDPVVSSKSPLMRGAKEAIAKIKEQGFEYYLISRRRKPEVAIELLGAKKLWPFYFDAKNSYFVTEPREKNKESEKLGINYFLDDELHVLVEMANVKHRFLFDPFDVYQEVKNPVEKVRSWSEFLRFLNLES